MRGVKPGGADRLRATLLVGSSLGTALALLPPVPARANPAGGTVVAGAAGIAGAGRVLTITQSSNRAIIDWHGFSIGAGETTRFNLPAASAAILNRVTGGNPSVLLGKLSSNGQVYLINPSGVVIGPHGKVNTAGFVASTLDLPDAAFMQGGSLTFAGGSTARIVNLGSIKTSAGDVALIALDVANKGSIAAPNGQAILAAGGEVLYVPDGGADVLIKPAATPGRVNNKGIIAAARVQLRAAGSAYALAVNNGGQVSATAVDTVGGQVVLDGGAGDVVSTGSVAAAGPAGSGGDVAMTGGRVAVTGSVDASGPRHGGTISLTARTAITVSHPAVLRADATRAGNGGAIRIKAEGATQFDGTASARGGPAGGNGGNAEISGGTLGFTGLVDLTAPQGKTGSLLFDPDSITIDSSATPLPSGVASSGIWDYSANPGAQTVSAAAIAAELASSNLTMNANQSIAVNAPITSTTSNFLALNAPVVGVNASISLPNGTLNFDGTITSVPPGQDTTVTTIGQSLTSASNATLAAGTMFIDGFAEINLAGPVQTGTMYVNQTGLAAASFSAVNGTNAIGSILLGDGFGTADTYSGSFALRTANALTVEGMTNATGGIAITADGALTLSAADVTETQLASAGGQITLASTGSAFINDVGTTLFSGTGRRVIYSATDGSGFNAGGLGYPIVNPVSYGNDPDSTASDVLYLAAASLLPTLTITVNGASRQYGLTDPAFTASYSGGTSADLLTLPQFRIVGGSDTNVGSYAIQPYGAVASNYRIVYADGTLNVTRAPLVITPDLTKIYGASIPLSLPSNDFSGLLNGDTTSVLLSQPTLNTIATAASSVGSYTLTASAAAAENYAISYEPGTLIVQPAPLVITPNVSRAYGGALPALLSATDFSGLVNGDTPASLSRQPTLNTAATATSGVGTYAITASGGASPNYTIRYDAGTVTITPAPLTIGIRSATQVYGGAPSVVFSYSGFVNGQGAANLASGAVPFTTANAASPVGTYSVVGTGADAPNYQITYAPGTLTVSPALLTVTPDLRFTYGGTLPVSLPETDFAGFVNGDTAASLATQPVLHTAATSNSSVGSYAITASGAALANYTITYAPGAVTVAPAPLVITPGLSRVYGSALPSSLPAGDFSGFVNGDTPSVLLSQPVLSTAANAASPVGGYGLSASGARAANYAITYQPGTLVVTPAPLLISGSGTQTYGGSPDVAFSYTGLVGGDSAASLLQAPRFTSAARASSQPGSYALTFFGAADPNYQISYASGLMVVTPEALLVTDGNVVRYYGQAVATTLQYSGLVNGDTASSIFSLLPQAADDPATRGVGSYAASILPGTQTNFGYSVRYASGSVTVVPAPLVIAANSVTLPYGQAVPPLTGTFEGLAPGTQPSNSGYGFAVNFPNGKPQAGGIYQIELVGSNPDYTVSYTPGLLSIESATVTALPPTTVNMTPSPALTNLNADPTINANDTSTQPSPSVTVNIPVVTPTFDWAGLGNDAIPEETAILQQYVAQSAGANPPVTLGALEAELAGSDATSLTMKASLMPFVYSQLSAILQEPQSQWTASQAAFVAGMQNFISQQQQQAAIQAENAYAAWQQQQQEIEEQKLAGLSGPAYAEMASILSANPPVPPPSFIQIAQGGTALTPQQSISKLGIEVASSEIDDAAQQIETQRVQAEYTWLLANTADPAKKASLEKAQSELTSSDQNVVVNAEESLDQAYQNASGPSNVPGFTPGSIGDVGTVLWRITFAATGNVGEISNLLPAQLTKVIFPHKFSTGSLAKGKAIDAETGAEIDEITAKVEDAVNSSEQTGQTVTDTVKTATSVAEDVAKTTSEVSSTLDSIAAFTGPVGLALELVGNVLQAGVGMAEYMQVGVYNAQFAAAVNKANAPVSVADLKAMLNSSNGQGQLLNDIASAMAVGDSAPPTEVQTKSLTTLVSYAY